MTGSPDFCSASDCICCSLTQTYFYSRKSGSVQGQPPAWCPIWPGAVRGSLFITRFCDSADERRRKAGWEAELFAWKEKKDTAVWTSDSSSLATSFEELTGFNRLLLCEHACMFKHALKSSSGLFWLCFLQVSVQQLWNINCAELSWTLLEQFL